jgi:RNA polymerase sigma factor (sigma-70 family)
MDPTSSGQLQDEEQVLVEIIAIVRRYALRHWSVEDAEDLAHDEALRCLTLMRAGEWHVTTSLESYLYSLVDRRALDAARRSHRRARLDADFVLEQQQGSHAWMNPGLALDEAEQEQFYQRTLASLPRRCRQVYAMVREENISYEQAAERIGISRSRVCRHMVTANHHFRKAMRKRALPSSVRSDAR